MTGHRDNRGAFLRFAAIQLALVVLAFSPLLISLGAGHLGAALGCRVDESGTHPCSLAGHDIGEALYTAGLFGWLVLATLPFGAALWVGHVGFTLWRLFRHFRSIRAAG